MGVLNNVYSTTSESIATFISRTLQCRFKQRSRVAHKMVKIRIVKVVRHTPLLFNAYQLSSSHGAILHKQTLRFVEPIAGSRVS